MFHIISTEGARRGSIRKTGLVALFPLVAVTVIALESMVLFFHGA